MRILIAGGGGYLGSALLKHLAGEHDCICFGHGTRFPDLSKILPGAVEYVEGDVTDVHLLKKIMAGVDAVIHVAGTGGEADCLANPTRSLLAHVHGTHLLMREAQRNNIAKLIFTSTIAVYGTYQPRPMPLTEDMEPRPDEFYGALKATAERELIDSGCFKILRLANVYGYGSGLFSLSSGVAGKFVDLIARGEALRIFGDGSQLIDYVHIDDVCRAYELALLAPAEQNFIFNVGGGQPISILTLAETTARIAYDEMARRAEIQRVPAPPDKLWPDRWLSIANIAQGLAWSPSVSIDDGLREMIVNWAGERVEA